MNHYFLSSYNSLSKCDTKIFVINCNNFLILFLFDLNSNIHVIIRRFIFKNSQEIKHSYSGLIGSFVPNIDLILRVMKILLFSYLTINENTVSKSLLLNRFQQKHRSTAVREYFLAGYQSL